MPRAYLDQSIERRNVGDFAFPLGVYPLEDVAPTPGFVAEFEPSEGSEPFLTNPEGFEPGGYEGGEFEEWPDRIMFDVQVSATRLPALVRFILTLLPGRVFPILDVIGTDAYREIDPYIAFEPVGVERVFDALRTFGDWLFEDGFVGFGAMSLDPFVYLFVDEHKILTIRVQLDLRDRVEKALKAFALAEVKEITAVDSAHHEHRGVLESPSDKPDAADFEEIVERLRDMWLLQLNIDPTRNVDDDGKDLGRTLWRCLARCAADEEGPYRYAEVFLTAGSLDEAERLATDAVADGAGEDKVWLEVGVPLAMRITAEQLGQMLGETPASLEVPAAAGVIRVIWAEDEAPASEASG